MEHRQQWAYLLAAARGVPVEADRDILLGHAMDVATDVAPGVLAASVTERHGSSYETRLFSDQVAVALDQAQYAAGSGPCMDAANRRHPVHLPVVNRVHPYLAFSASAKTHGVNSSLSLPLQEARTPAALNLYSAVAMDFEGLHARRAADLLAHCIAITFDDAAPRDRLADAAATTPTPVDMEDARGTVRAGMKAVAAIEQLSTPEAYLWLVHRAERQRRSVRHVAAEYLHRHGIGTAP